jgi:hypothetical protein
VRLDNEKVPVDVPVAGPRLNPVAFDFGSVANGSFSALQKFKVHVYGSEPVTFGAVTITGADAADFVSSAGRDTCSGQTIPAGSTCQVKVRFRPAGPATGARSATLSLPTSDPTVTLTSALTGTSTGAPTLTLNPLAFDWGTIATGATSQRQKFTIANYGNANLVLGALTIGGADAGQFEIVASTDGCSGQTLAPHTSCFARLRFRPTSAGAKTAQLEVPSNAAGGLTTSALSGTGG